MSAPIPVWFITGTSTGIGRSIAEYALSQGYRVAATARKVETLAPLVEKYPDHVLAVTLDVTKKSDITAAVDAVVQRFGRIDVVINNAGYLLAGMVEELPEEKARQQMETNFYGAVAVSQAVIPIMRAQKSGAIVQISSVLGSLVYPGTGLYSASKFALEAVSEALAQELASFGIKVLIVQPGSFRTPIWSTGIVLEEPSNAYAGSPAALALQGFDSYHGKQPGNPDLAGKAIDVALRSDHTPLRLPLGSDSYHLITKTKTALLETMKGWESVSLSTDFE